MASRERWISRIVAPARRKILWALALATLPVALVAWNRARANPQELARAARKAHSDGNVVRARELVRQALKLAPSSSEVLVAAGELALNDGDAVLALSYYDRVPADGTIHAIVGAGAAGDLFIKSHRLSDAERSFRKILAADPHHVLANRRLAALLVMAGRRRESAPYLFELVRTEECDVDELALLGNLEQVFDNEELLDRLCKSAPDDPLPFLGAARMAMQNSQVAKAANILAPLVARAPELDEARINLGKVLVDRGTMDEYLEWHSRLPAALSEQPDIWVIRGQFAERRGELDQAVRCYWEALRGDPNLWKASYQLGLLLTARGDDRARLFLERARKLKTLVDTLKKVLQKGVTVDLALTAAQTTEALGRPWEAWAWYRFVVKLQPEHPSAKADYYRLEQSLSEDTPRTIVSTDPALLLDLSSFPLPQWKSAPSRESNSDGPGQAPDRGRGKVRFADLAESAGIHFTYENGDDHDVPGHRLHQSFGGGVGVLDYDGDGWPDLFFTQGGQLVAASDEHQPVDQLFRNLGYGKFVDVTAQSGVGDDGYGQGVAAGDYDNDGFCDLLVANIGQSRLYHNLGDGTFSDATAGSGIAFQAWSTSCLIADLNGDALPDIYVVTYAAGRRPLELLCDDPDLHEYRTCPPTMFDGEQDRLYLNRGDGTFDDVTTSARILVLVPDGRGLGAVAADFELTGRLNIFVANDMAANFYFVNETLSPGASPQFSEQAILTGCAYNGVGRTQANMGIAVADANGDGLLDIYVSTFLHEYNVLYQQQPAGLFSDRTSQAGLKGPSSSMLGFGTQFIDADLDGWPDLVVTNGHVDDFTKKGLPFRMSCQFYANLGGGRFSELPSSELGDYFERKLLGRGLARLDWNRDGREDFAVSHLDTPAALVTNQSPQTGHFLALQLRGVQSNRDAVGAVVRAAVSGRTLMQQITAGDGYYASNQKQLIFGLSDAESVIQLQIRWPSGVEQRFDDVSSDQELLVVEGRSQLYRLPRP